MVQQKLTIGQEIELSLASWGRLGEAMACHEGQDVFVLGGIPGETVVAEVVRIRRKYVAARVVKSWTLHQTGLSRPANITVNAPDASGSTWTTGHNW